MSDYEKFVAEQSKNTGFWIHIALAIAGILAYNIWDYYYLPYL